MSILKRDGELWIGPVGLFWGHITGIELPSGRFIGFTYGYNTATGFKKG
jgi:hypothetical protein